MDVAYWIHLYAFLCVSFKDNELNQPVSRPLNRWIVHLVYDNQ